MKEETETGRPEQSEIHNIQKHKTMDMVDNEVTDHGEELARVINHGEELARIINRGEGLERDLSEERIPDEIDIEMPGYTTASSRREDKMKREETTIKDKEIHNTRRQDTTERVDTEMIGLETTKKSRQSNLRGRKETKKAGLEMVEANIQEEVQEKKETKKNGHDVVEKRKQEKKEGEGKIKEISQNRINSQGNRRSEVEMERVFQETTKGSLQDMLREEERTDRQRKERTKETEIYDKSKKKIAPINSVTHGTPLDGKLNYFPIPLTDD